MCSKENAKKACIANLKSTKRASLKNYEVVGLVNSTQNLLNVWPVWRVGAVVSLGLLNQKEQGEGKGRKNIFFLLS